MTLNPRQADALLSDTTEVDIKNLMTVDAKISKNHGANSRHGISYRPEDRAGPLVRCQEPFRVYLSWGMKSTPRELAEGDRGATQERHADERTVMQDLAWHGSREGMKSRKQIS